MICDEIDGEDEAARRAEALEGGDDAALAVEIGAHRVGDADAADHQRRQARPASGTARSARCCADSCGAALIARADAPAGLGKCFVRAVADARRAASSPARRRRADTCRRAGPGCRAGSARSRAAPSSETSSARREAEAVGRSVRLGDELGAQFEGRLPSLIAVAELQAEPLEQQVRRGRAEHAVPARRTVRPAAAPARSTSAPIERIGRVDRLQLDQRLVGAVLEPRHRAHVARWSAWPRAFEERRSLGVRLALVELEARCRRRAATGPLWRRPP